MSEKKDNLVFHHFFLINLIVLLKFYFVHILVFREFNIIHTILLEFGFILFIFSIVELIPFKFLKNGLYITLNLLISIVLFAILLYHDYFGNIVTYHALSQLGEVGGIGDSIFSLIKPIYTLLFVDVFLIIILMLAKNNFFTTAKKINRKLLSLFLLIGLVLSLGNLFLQKEIEIASSVISAETKGIITYEVLSFQDQLMVLEDDHIDFNQLKLIKTIRDIKQTKPIPYSKLRYFGIAKDKNIIIIQGEAFQNFVLHLKVDGKEITPNLNKLLEESLYFPNIYQQIGPGNTSDAEFILNTSIYPDPFKATFKNYSDRKIPSFPRLLKDKGYYTMTFHTNKVAFWNRIEMYPALGFDKYFDITFFGRDDIISMGASDEVLYDKSMKVLRYLRKNNQKFYASYITLSSHHPFKIPEEKNVIQLPQKYNDTMVGDYLKSIHYTDQMLGKFIRLLKEENLWEDSIFVFYGDHFGLQHRTMSETDLKLASELVGHSYSLIDRYNVPLIIAVPGKTKGEIIETVGGQLDFMPTIANLLGTPLNNEVYFGQDIINYKDNLLGIRYYLPNGSFLNNDIIFIPEKSFEDGHAYRLDTQKEIKSYLQYKVDYDRVMRLMKLSDQYLNSLPKR